MEETVEHSDQWVEARLKFERRAVNHEKDRIIDAMNTDVLLLKQKMLNDCWSKLQEIVASDPSNAAMYKQMCPALFGPLSAKLPKRRTLKKPQLPKVNVNITRLDLGETRIVSDMCGIKPHDDGDQTLREGKRIMITQSGQRWVVKIKCVKEGTYCMTYCDGSSSQITQSEAQTLGLRFEEIPPELA